MNKLDFLHEEMHRKVREANSRNTQYNFSFYMDDTSFYVRVFANHTPTNTSAAYTIAEYTPFMKNDPMAEEKALNYAISEMNYFLRDSTLKSGIRLGMYMDLLKDCKEKGKSTEWIADYLNLDPEIMKGVSA